MVFKSVDGKCQVKVLTHHGRDKFLVACKTGEYYEFHSQNNRVPLFFVSLIYLAGCAASRSSITDVGQPESPVRELCDKGDYHAAMRELPTAMAQWEQYTERTGDYCEGAAGFLYVTTMSFTALKGDLHWAKILDDPDIPYVYKTEMIFEILEARLGKGSVYVGNKQNFIVPRFRPIDFDKEKMIALPD